MDGIFRASLSYGRAVATTCDVKLPNKLLTMSVVGEEDAGRLGKKSSNSEMERIKGVCPSIDTYSPDTSRMWLS